MFFFKSRFRVGDLVTLAGGGFPLPPFSSIPYSVCCFQFMVLSHTLLIIAIVFLSPLRRVAAQLQGCKTLL